MSAFNTSPITNLTSFTPNTSSFHRVTTEWGQQPPQPQHHERRCNNSSPKHTNTPTSSPSSSTFQLQSHASQFAPIRRRQPFGGFDDRASAPSSPRTSRPPSVTQSQQSTMIDLRPSKIMKTSNENVYEKTMRLLMTANQETLPDVQPMEEDNEEDGLGQPIEGQSSILSFFTRRNNNCMEED